MELKVHKGHLLEVSRKDLAAKSRVQSKTRFSKRLNYQVSNFRGVDLKQMFENDYFVFKTPIKDYVCIVAFPGVFTQLRNVVKETHGDVRKINLQMVIKALRRAFDATDDVKVDCTCADWRYRYAYWASQNGYKYGEQETRPSDITNPDDAIGATCKHLNLLLSNKRWLTKAASVVNSFIKTYPDKAALYLYDEDEVEKDDDESKVNFEVPEETPTEKEVPEEEISDEGSEEFEDEEEGEEPIEDSLNLSESVTSSDSEFLDTSDRPRDWVLEKRQKLVDFNTRVLKYAGRLDLLDKIQFAGYHKYSRRENYSTYTMDCKDGKLRRFYILFGDDQYKFLYNGSVVKSNKDPQKIVKYIFDTYLY